MEKKDVEELQKRVEELEAELSRYRSELTSANQTLEKLIQQVGHELKVAVQIQKILAPTEIPTISGFDFSTKFVPGNKSGGDYFDIFEHSDRLKFGILVASSSGHAMSALLLSVLIRMASQIEARRGLDPHLMVAKLAQELKPQMSEKDSASLFYGVVDRRNYELKFSLLGNIEAYWQESAKGNLQRLDPFAGVLSKDFNTEPQSMSIYLNSQDRVVICTEGITSAKNGAGKPWGSSGLQESIESIPTPGVHELRNNILLRNEQFTGKLLPDRDQTLIVIEVKDKIIKLA